MSEFREFKPLTGASRSMTFDTRMITRSDIVEAGFNPIVRAATFAGQTNTVKRGMDYNEVLYRRYFNVKEKRTQRPSVIPQQVTKKEAVIVVDPFSTGSQVAEYAEKKGYSVICVYSDTLDKMELLLAELAHSNKQFEAVLYFDGGAPHDDAVAQLLANIDQLPYNIVAILAGAETGVLLTDIISEQLNMVTNGTKLSEARRDKYAMGERIRNVGLRAVYQRKCSKWSEVKAFLDEWNPTPFVCVVKPIDSAGSDDVYKCRSEDEVKKAFGNIMGKINTLGLENKYVLIQEFLDGKEYVVDTVGYKGKHKVVAVWEYDKRAVNGAPFVYFSSRLRPANDPVIEKIIDYQLKVIEALGINYGPTHGEIKFVRGEPCLVEVGARCHGGGGAFIPIVNECLGYNQPELAVEVYLNPAAWEAIPDRPIKLAKYAAELDGVCYEKGVLKGYPGLNNLKSMSSFRTVALHAEIDHEVIPTVDLFSSPLSVMMCNESESQLLKDILKFHEMCKSGLMDIVQPEMRKDPKKTGIVVVVDPFSTGAVLAKNVSDRGFRTICVYSDSLEAMQHVAGLIPPGLELSFEATVDYRGDVEDLCRRLRDISPNVLAVIPGAETGVLVADLIANHLGCRSNPLDNSIARRDKYIMGETIRAAGIRAVQQQKCTSWSDVEEFLQRFTPDPFKIIIKPVDSAGSDDVTLCKSKGELESAFRRILGKINGLGIANTSVLVQEYLEGDEYVIDSVSRDGVHKVVAIWKYDKRPVNDAPFVYFTVRLMPASDPIVASIIQYQMKVLDALGFVNGPGHGEVKLTRGEPCLVEVGARCHGGEGQWCKVTDHCIGFDQVGVTVDAFLDEDRFNSIPERVMKLKKEGIEAMLVSYQEGTLKSLPGLELIKTLDSTIHTSIYVKLGSKLSKTRDVFTCPGTVLLVNDSEELLMRDVDKIRELEHKGLFITE